VSALVCIVAVVCTAANDGLTCDIVRSECISVTDERETQMRKWCDAAANCVEPTKRIFVVRETPTTPTPGPIAPPTKGGGRV